MSLALKKGEFHYKKYISEHVTAVYSHVSDIPL
jgi:hypothetical protein